MRDHLSGQMQGADQDRERSLTISYVFSQFPLPTQSFAVSDIDALRHLGQRVFVHTLKPLGRDKTTGVRLLETSADQPVLRPSLKNALHWPALLWRRRAQLQLLLRLILPQFASQPASALTALLCIPRALEIAEEIVQLRSDVVHLFWSRYAALVLPVLRDMKYAGVRTSFVGAYDLVADDFVVKLALACADTVFSHAEANRGFIEARAPAAVPVRIIHRGIPLAKPHDEVERDKSLWLTASALVPEKNVGGVIKTFARARVQAPDLWLMVCGDGPERGALEQLGRQLGCADAIQFAGHIERQQLFALMRQANTFVMLSHKPSERLPNVIKEALWSGCAVIASRSEGIEELIPDPGIGIVVDHHDDAAIAAAVATILHETDHQAHERQRRAHDLIANRFSNIESMQRYVAEWQALREGNVT